MSLNFNDMTSTTIFQSLGSTQAGLDPVTAVELRPLIQRGAFRVLSGGEQGKMVGRD